MGAGVDAVLTKGRSCAISGGVAKMRDITHWKSATLVTHLFRKAIALLRRGLIARIAKQRAIGSLTMFIA